MSNKNTNNKTKLDYIVEVLFLLLVFFFPASIALRNVFLGLLFVFWMLNKLVKKDLTLSSSEFNKYIGFFFLFSLLSIFKANNLDLSLDHLVSPIIRYLAFYFIAIDLINESKIKKYLDIILISNLTLISYGLYVDYFTKNSFFHRANGMGTVSTFMVIFFLSYLFYNDNSWYKKIFIGLGIIGSGTALMISYSRGAVLGFIGAILIWCSAVLWSKLKDKRNSKLIIISVLVLILGITPFLLPDRLINRFKKIKNIEANNSLRTRVAMWKSSGLMIKRHPILGVGIGNFRPHYLAHLKDELKSYQGRVGINHDHPHNLYLHIAAEQGIISLIIILIIYIKSYQLAVRNYLLNKNYKFLGLALLGMLTSLGIHSLVDTTFRYGHVGYYIILFAIFNLKAFNKEGANIKSET